MKTFTTLYAEIGPDNERIAEILHISPSDADRLKNYMMDNKVLGLFEKKYINQRARRMVQKHALAEIRRQHA